MGETGWGKALAPPLPPPPPFSRCTRNSLPTDRRALLSERLEQVRRNGTRSHSPISPAWFEMYDSSDLFVLTNPYSQINGLIVATLSHDQMIDILRKPGSVSAVIVPPFQSGKPRKCVPPTWISRFTRKCSARKAHNHWRQSWWRQWVYIARIFLIWSAPAGYEELVRG